MIGLSEKIVKIMPRAQEKKRIGAKKLKMETCQIRRKD